ncbi:hypothetical protein FRC19_003994 [Serendipita sp. 401]|nr:hypothetical protein FRC19_003994 [Serendipita sp. 401]KAG9020115.1 hypothetical protein FS842_007582 [Serendipita sp. 407]
MTKQFYIRLTHGITGGIVPANPTSVQTLTSSIAGGQGSILFQRTTRKHEEAKLPDEPTAQATLPSSTHTKVDDLIEELEGILKEIPTESPPGSKDIYGMDIGLMFGSDDLQWMNGGPAGCGSGWSENEPTEDQVEKFKRAVEIVEELGKLSGDA